MTMRHSDYEVIARGFLANYHNGDYALVDGWRRNADRRWCLTLQFVISLCEGKHLTVAGGEHVTEEKNGKT